MRVPRQHKEGKKDQGEKPGEKQLKGPAEEDELRKVKRVSLKKSRENF